MNSTSKDPEVYIALNSEIIPALKANAPPEISGFIELFLPTPSLRPKDQKDANKWKKDIKSWVARARGPKELSDEEKRYLLYILPKSQLVIIGNFHSAEDITFHVKRRPEDVFEQLLAKEREKLSERRKETAEKFSLDLQLILLSPSEKIENYAMGRAIVCSCSGGDYWSITFRKQEGEIGGREFLRKNLSKYSRYNPAQPSSYRKKKVVAQHCEPISETVKEEEIKHLNSIYHICRPLYDLIFPKDCQEDKGLVVVAGRTGSCKSNIIRGLIFQYLKAQHPNLAKKQRALLHLLTVEDPIEEYFYKASKDNLAMAQDYGLDYTPRVKGVDVADIKCAINDALRQTPAAMFVGETRNAEEWAELIRFAGTGHLIFTTAHAGSVKEMMSDIFRATRATTPTTRSMVASRILALIHLKPGRVENPARNILLPAIWVRTPSGMQTLMAEGLASLLPHNPGSKNPKLGSYGRRWFAKKLLAEIKESEPGDLGNKVIEKSIEWDMEGI